MACNGTWMVSRHVCLLTSCSLWWMVGGGRPVAGDRYRWLLVRVNGLSHQARRPMLCVSQAAFVFRVYYCGKMTCWRWPLTVAHSRVRISPARVSRRYCKQMPQTRRFRLLSFGCLTTMQANQWNRTNRLGGKGADRRRENSSHFPPRRGEVILAPQLVLSKQMTLFEANNRLSSTEAWVREVWSGRGSQLWTGTVRNLAALARARRWLQLHHKQHETIRQAGVDTVVG